VKVIVWQSKTDAADRLRCCTNNDQRARHAEAIGIKAVKPVDVPEPYSVPQLEMRLIRSGRKHLMMNNWPKNPASSC
jgi:hypothetical protein